MSFCLTVTIVTQGCCHCEPVAYSLYWIIDFGLLFFKMQALYFMFADLVFDIIMIIYIQVVVVQ